MRGKQGIHGWIRYKKESYTTQNQSGHTEDLLLTFSHSSTSLCEIGFTVK